MRCLCLLFLLGWGLSGLAILSLTSSAFGAAQNVWVEVPAGWGAEGNGEPTLAVPNEIVICVRPEGLQRFRARADLAGGNLRFIVPRRERQLAGVAGGFFERLAVLTLPPGRDLEAVLQEVSRHPDVLYAEPNLRLHTAVEEMPQAEAPNDFEFNRQWGLHNTGQTGGVPGADIGALTAWAITTGSSNILVAIIDTGVDYFHPDLSPNIWINPREIPGNGVDDDGNGYVDDIHGFDFVSDDGDPMDDNVHGTHVAGILGAVGNDENGVAGVAWSVRMMALKAFDEAGAGTLDDTLAAIAYATRAGARIINASWGTTTRSRALDEAVAAAVKQGTVFVAAAGNNGSDIGFFPAAIPEAIAVAASNAEDKSPTFSNYGSFVDLVAPGDGIHSTAPNAAWTVLSGTSMAAPYVSGVATLLLARRPDFTPSQVETILRSTAVELRTDRFTGAGRVHAGRALAISEPLPDAALDVPPVWSGQLDLRGTAAGNRFAGFKLELGLGNQPESWEVLRSGNRPEESVLLPNFDSTAHDDGDYTLRLSVTNSLGQAAVVRRAVSIRNVQLTSPLNNDVLRGGETIAIRGTVAGLGRTFELSWGVGKDPGSWQTSGFELEQGGASPLIGAVIARWDSRVAPTNDFVTFRLAATRNGRVVGEAFARMVHVETRMRAGWPLYLPFSEEPPSRAWREFNVADLDGDGVQEIVFVDHGEPAGRAPRLVVLDPSGAVKWSRELPAGAPEFDAPVVGDIDGDGRREIFVDTGEGGVISAFDATGAPLAGEWPVAPGGTHFGKILADLDGDGASELIAVANPPPDLVSVQQRRLVVLNARGELLRSWSLTGCSEDVNVPELLPAVANLDNDDDLEIVAVDGCQGISAFDLKSDDDRPIWTTLTSSLLVASPVVGDLDGDGREEIVIGGVIRERGQPGGVHVFSRTGQLRDGWPILTGESFHASAALGDLDGDGWLEIVLPSWDSGKVHVIRADGFEPRGWPLPNQVNAAVRSIPVIGDIDGDERPDIVLASPGHWLHLMLTGDIARAGGIRAWRLDGSLIDLHPGTAADGLVMEAASGAVWNRFAPPVLGDLDGDGRLDIVASTGNDRRYSRTAPLTTAKMRSSLYAWSLDTPTTPEALPWPAFQGGPERTGRYYRPPPPNEVPVISEIPNQTIDVGGAFRPIPLDLYVADPDGTPAQLTWSVLGARDLVAIIDGNRVLTVEPLQQDWEGREVLELVVRDAGGAEARVEVAFSVIRGYRSPLAVMDRVSTTEEVPVTLNPLSNDTSPDQRPLRILSVSRPGSGTTELLPGNLVRYTPAHDFFGQDSFEYSVADDIGGFAIGEVRVTVANVNDPPSLGPDRLIIDEDTEGIIEPLANDVDVDGDELDLVWIDTPQYGQLESVGKATFRFVPPPNYAGVQSFSYIARDPWGLISTGEVAVLVKPINDAPVLNDQTVTLNRNRAADIIYAAEDADGDTLKFTILDGPTNGVLYAYPALANFEPRKGFVGTDRFTYSASDGLVSVGPATVTLVVEPSNNPPEVKNDSIVTAKDQPITIPLQVRDADDEEVTLQVSRQPSSGTVTLNGTNALYTPNSGFVGSDSFLIRPSDGIEEGRDAIIAVTVTDQNTPPRAQSEVLTVRRNATSPVILRAVDDENNPLQFEIVTNTVYGTLEGTPPNLSYTPRQNFRGLDRVYFVAKDREFTSDVAVVHLLVRDPNQVPFVTNQVVRVQRDQPVSFRLQAIDGDGHPLQSAILKGVRSGRLFGTGLDYTYVPRTGFEGNDTFTYRVWDGYALSAEGTVTLAVSRPQTVTLEISSVQLTEQGFELTLRGTPGVPIRIEGSTNLVEWELRELISNSSGTVRWRDRGSIEDAIRFYRASAVESGAGQ